MNRDPPTPKAGTYEWAPTRGGFITAKQVINHYLDTMSKGWVLKSIDSEVGTN